MYAYIILAPECIPLPSDDEDLNGQLSKGLKFSPGFFAGLKRLVCAGLRFLKMAPTALANRLHGLLTSASMVFGKARDT
jgi:hypothetical protein